MKKIFVIIALVVSFAAGAAVTVTLQNPIDYNSENWISICVYNRQSAEGDYRGEIQWSPYDSGSKTRTMTLSTTRSTAILPPAYQTFINTWIGYARADFPAFN